jgi:hypothetical protein
MVHFFFGMFLVCIEKYATFADKIYCMSSYEKLLERFLRFPNDFTWNELSRLMGNYGFYQTNKGKTSGSRVAFENSDSNFALNLHKPHPKNVLKPYQLKDVFDFLCLIEVVN